MIIDWLAQNVDSDIRYTNSPDEIHICCPVCGETRYRMYINVREGLVYCHNCQFKGNFAKLIQYINGGKYSSAVEQFKQLYGVASVPIQISESISERLLAGLYQVMPNKRAIPLPDEYQRIFETKNLVANRAIKYLANRGITRGQMLRYNLGICATGEYRNRIIIPITQEGKLKFWVARAIGSKMYLKEKSPSNQSYQFSKSEVIFNLDYAARKFNSVVISEGIYDALSWGGIGVSLLGKVLYDSQLQLILDYKPFLTQGVYIALDADARDSAIKIAERLKSFFPVKIVDIPEEFDDPNRYFVTHSRLKLWKLLENAREYTELSAVWLKLRQ